MELCDPLGEHPCQRGAVRREPYQPADLHVPAPLHPGKGADAPAVVDAARPGQPRPGHRPHQQAAPDPHDKPIVGIRAVPGTHMRRAAVILFNGCPFRGSPVHGPDGAKAPGGFPGPARGRDRIPGAVFLLQKGRGGAWRGGGGGSATRAARAPARPPPPEYRPGAGPGAYPRGTSRGRAITGADPARARVKYGMDARGA